MVKTGTAAVIGVVAGAAAGTLTGFLAHDLISGVTIPPTVTAFAQRFHLLGGVSTPYTLKFLLKYQVGPQNYDDYLFVFQAPNSDVDMILSIGVLPTTYLVELTRLSDGNLVVTLPNGTTQTFGTVPDGTIQPGYLLLQFPH